MDADRKFRIIADVIEHVTTGRTTIEKLWTVMTATGDIRKAEVESLARLASELGFLRIDEDGSLLVSGSGRSFVRYMTALDKKEMQKKEPPIDRGTELKLCVTVPPRWKKRLMESFGDELIDTLRAEGMVSEDARTNLLIISPFIDVAVLQLALMNVDPGAVGLTIITSEPALVKEYKGGMNYVLEKMRNLILSRFKSGVVYFMSDPSSIAHAKVWCSEKSVLITSANVKSDSTTDNLEVGVYTDDTEMVYSVNEFAGRLLQTGGLRCILRTP